MRRILIFCIGILGFVISAMGQGTLSTATPNPVPAGYSGSMVITGTGTQFHVATAGINLKLTHAGSGQIYNFGNAPFGAAWGWATSPTQCNGNISIPVNAPTGSYHVELRGYSGDNYMQNMMVNTTSFLVIGGSCGFYEGKVIMDQDSNCTQGVGDHPFTSTTIVATPGPYYGITDYQGNFRMALPIGSYTFSVASTPFGTLPGCPASGSQVATVSTHLDTTSGINFYFKPNSGGDIAVTVSNGNHRPGFTNNSASVTVYNSQYVDAPNTVVKLVKPSAFAFTGTWHPMAPDAINGDTAIWNVGTLGLMAYAYRSGYVTVPANTPLNTPFTYQGLASCGLAETNTVNNQTTVNGTVTGSYDPNDKQVWTATGANADGFVEPTDTTLRYLIRFQNTGTDTAFTIVVRDTFDTDLDISSLRILGASHPMNTEFTDSTGLRARFVFNNILLADSNTNEPASHGWLEYTIRKKNGLTNGTVMSNRASIYFDFNPPILTNRVNSTICPSLGTAFNQSVTNLTAAFTGPTTGGANGWAWNFGDGQSGTGANPSHTYAAGGTYTVCVTVTNSCGRSKQICQSVTVTCAALTAGFNSTPGSGYTMNFANTSTGSLGTMQWTFGDGNFSTATNPSHTYASFGTYQVCLIVTDVCNNSDTVCQTFTVCQTLNGDFAHVVNVNVAAFLDQSTGDNLSYLWDFGDGTTDTAASPTHVYHTAGTFQACLTVTDACMQSETVCSSVVVVCVPPTAGFNTAVNMATVTFTDQTIDGPTAWFWDFGDGNTSTLQNPVHTYAVSGTYSACLTASNNCDSSTACQGVTIIVNGMGSLNWLDISILPNPARDRAVLRITQAQLKEVEFQLMDALGRTVEQWQVADIQSDYVHELDLSMRAAGIWFLRVNVQGLQRTLRLVVSN
jgi:PKD repeat protein